MGQKLTIEFHPRDGGKVATTYDIENGIKVIDAIDACNHFVKMINEKILEHGKKIGYEKGGPVSETASFIKNISLEELF